MCAVYRKTTYTDGPELIEITVLPGAPPSDAVEARHHDFIAENWPSLSAASYDGFQRFGVGAVVVQGDPVQPTAVPFQPREIFYATSFGAWVRQQFNEAPSEALEEAFETYDPRDAGLFIFLEDGAPPRAYSVESTLKPPQALARVRALLN